MKKDHSSRPYVAVASREGMLVNQHLGEALNFSIWRQTEEGGYAQVETRPAPNAGGGPNRWYALAETLKDCRAVLVSGVGDTPRTVLEEEGVAVVAMGGFIAQGLDAAYKTGNFDAFKVRQGGGCCATSGCTGGGEGCG